MKLRLLNYNYLKPKMFKVALSLGIGLLAFFSITPMVALAIDNPTSTSINNGFVFRDLLEEGDLLVYVRYDVNYAVAPEELAEDTFEVVMYDEAGVVILGNRSLNYYQHNIISIYFTAAEVVSKGIVWNGAYIIKVRGYLSVFPIQTEGINVATQTLSSGNYKEGDELTSRLLAEANILQTDWEITLITGDFLNETGMFYFTKAIPNLGTIAPNISYSTTVFMTVNYTDWNTTYEEGLHEHQGPRLQAAIQDLANMLSVSEDWMAIWLTSIAYLTFAGVVYSITKDPGIAMLTGFPIIVGAAYLGVGLSMLTIVIAITIIAAVLFGIHFILARMG